MRDGFESHCGQLRFGTFAIRFTPPCQCLSEDTKSCRSLLSGVYARGSKISHQSALECVTVVDPTTHSKNSPPPDCEYAAENAALHLYRKKICDRRIRCLSVCRSVVNGPFACHKRQGCHVLIVCLGTGCTVPTDATGDLSCVIAFW